MKSVKSVRLGDVAQFIRGINFKPDDVVPVGTEGSVACMRTKNVQELLDCADVWGVSKDFVRRQEQMLNLGDILVSSANSWNLVGKCCWIPEIPWPATFGGFVSVLRADTAKVDPRFLYWWFSSEKTQVILRSFGQKTTNISNLNIERCLNLQMPLPTLPEQTRISAILDQVDAVRIKRKAALAKLDSLIQAIFIKMFGDASFPYSTLGAVTNLKRGPFGGALKKEIFVDEGYMVYEQRNAIYNDCITGRYFINEPKYREMIDFAVMPQDLIISCSGTLGKVAIIPNDAPKGVINQALLRVRVDDAIVTPLFIKHVFESAETQNKLLGISHGTGLQNFPPMSEIKSLPVATPPLQLQHEFARRVYAVENLRSLHLDCITELDNLFASLQHRAFCGEL